MSTDSLKEYNNEIFRLIRERENLFKQYAKYCEILPTEHWIIYTIYIGENKGYTQKMLSEEWTFPKQTINTAAKKLKEQGIISFVNVPNSKREKYIYLTDSGLEIAEKLMKPLLEVELESFSHFTDDERNEFLRLFTKWKINLEKGIKKISTELMEDENV